MIQANSRGINERPLLELIVVVVVWWIETEFSFVKVISKNDVSKFASLRGRQHTTLKSKPINLVATKVGTPAENPWIDCNIMLELKAMQRNVGIVYDRLQKPLLDIRVFMKICVH